jgi:hypothetical protein
MAKFLLGLDKSKAAFQRTMLMLNHQGLEIFLIDGISQDTDGIGPVARRERLGGLLNLYYREAA